MKKILIKVVLDDNNQVELVEVNRGEVLLVNWVMRTDSRYTLSLNISPDQILEEENEED